MHKLEIGDTVAVQLPDGTVEDGIIEDICGRECAVRTSAWREKKWWVRSELRERDPLCAQCAHLETRYETLCPGCETMQPSDEIQDGICLLCWNEIAPQMPLSAPAIAAFYVEMQQEKRARERASQPALIPIPETLREEYSPAEMDGGYWCESCQVFVAEDHRHVLEPVPPDPLQQTEYHDCDCDACRAKLWQYCHCLACWKLTHPEPLQQSEAERLHDEIVEATRQVNEMCDRLDQLIEQHRQALGREVELAPPLNKHGLFGYDVRVEEGTAERDRDQERNRTIQCEDGSWW